VQTEPSSAAAVNEDTRPSEAGQMVETIEASIPERGGGEMASRMCESMP